MTRVISFVFVVMFVCGACGEVFGYETYSYDSPVYKANVHMSYKKDRQVSFKLPITGLSGNDLAWGSLVLTFANGKSPYDMFEYVRVSDGYSWSVRQVEHGDVIIPISQDGLTALDRNGCLVFTMKRLFGDFTFKTAELRACRVEPEAVPIPGAIWLFGSALIGTLGLRRIMHRA